MARRYCSYKLCRNNTEDDMGISFFRYPKEPERCSKWLKNCNRPDLNHLTPLQLYNVYKVCAVHFENCMFAGLSQSQLKRFAVPLQFSAYCPLFGGELIEMPKLIKYAKRAAAIKRA